MSHVSSTKCSSRDLVLIAVSFLAANKPHERIARVQITQAPKEGNEHTIVCHTAERSGIDDCLPANPSLRDLQFVDLFPAYEEGVQKLISFFLPAPSRPTPDAQNLTSQISASVSRRFGDEARQLLQGLAADAHGNILMVGDFWGSIDFGGSTLQSDGDRDIFLAKFDSQGNHMWSKSYGDEREQVGVGVATDGAGATFVVSAFNGSLDFGGGPLVSRGRYNIALAKLDANGTHVWSKCIGDDNYHVPECIAATPSGTVVIAGRFHGSLDFAGALLQSQSKQSDISVTVFSAHGECVFANM